MDYMGVNGSDHTVRFSEMNSILAYVSTISVKREMKWYTDPTPWLPKVTTDGAYFCFDMAAVETVFERL